MNRRNPKKNKLEKDLEGKPKITLKPLKKTAVNTLTQEEYNALMQVYECGGRRWSSGDLPTQFNCWNTYKGKTCIRARTKNKFGFGTADIGYLGHKIISIQEFYNKQKITQENIDEINKWFKKNA